MSERGLLVPPVPFLSSPAVRLFLTGATVLFAELVLLRWIPANVIYVGFFSNLLLIGCFLGIGAGVLASRGPLGRLAASPFPFLLLGTVLLVTKNELNVQVRSTDEIFFGLSESHAADANFFVLILVVGLSTLLVASVALPLGPLLASLPPLRAYALELSGSMAGIALFTALSATQVGPVAWLSVLAGLLLLSALGRGVATWSLASGAALLAAIGLVSVAGPRRRDVAEVWSPYYRLSVYAVADEGGGGTSVNANGIPHQTMITAARATDPGRVTPYDQVYRWFPGRRFERVLIVGAGSGTDTAVALARGARHVDAVEIDPAIAEIGRELHPDRPYSSDRVSLHVDDGRSFVKRGKAAGEKWDLVVFALPDSLTLLTSQTSLRLESFLFTRESFEGVRDCLAPHGVFVLYNYYREEWLLAKIARMLEEVFGARPALRMAGGKVLAVIAAGPAVAESGGRPPGDQVTPLPALEGPAPATDDWPFLYLREPTIPRHYLFALALVLAWGILLVFLATRGSAGLSRASPHFFVLGAAFLLLETRSLVTFSLLFGATWVVNALAFFAILASVLLATLVSAALPAKRPALLYGALLLALALGFAVPPETLRVDPAWLRYALASAIAFAPVFAANLVFARSFKDARAADAAFGSNLVGATVGGALEYLSLLIGFRALLLVAAGLYALAWLLGSRVRLLGDRGEG